MTRDLQAPLEEGRWRISAEIFADIVDNARDAVLVIEDDGRIRYCNLAVEAVFGYTATELFREPVETLLPGAAPILHAARRGRAAADDPQTTGQPVTMEGRRKDGTVLALGLSITRTGNSDRPLLTLVAQDSTNEQLQVAPSADERFRLSIEGSADCVSIHDELGRYIYLNPAGEDLLGRPAKEVLGQHATTFVELEKSQVAEGILPAETRNYLTQVIRPDGTRVPVEVRAVALGDGTVLATARDVTSWVEAERSARVSEARLNRAQALTHVGSMEWVAETDRAVWSDEVWRILGLDPTMTAPGRQTWTARIHPDDRTRQAAIADDAQRARESGYEHSYRIRRPTGEIRHVKVVAELEYDEAGELSRRSGTVQDVTDRVVAADELRVQAELLETTLMSAPMILIALDRDGVFTLHDGGGLEKAGYRRNELVGQSIWDFPAEIQNRFRRVFAGEKVDDLFEINGRSLQVHYQPRFDATGAIDGVVGTALDVTELLGLERRLRQAQKMEMVGQLAGGVAHDFNNLLMVINGLASLLVETADRDDVRRDLQEILGAGERAAALTEQLLAFSRKQVLQPETLDLNEQIAGLMGLLRRLISEAVVIETDLGEEAFLIEADPAQLDQMLINLAINASQAMPDGGVLRLSTSRIVIPADDASTDASPEASAEAGASLVPGSYVQLTVRDSGSGMEPETLAHIFEPFFTTKEIGAGTGLGLASAEGFVKQSGGSISVSSAVGRGTTFRIRLPGAAGSRTEDAERTVAHRRGEGRVLLVEDDPAVRRFEARIMREHGYEVVQVASGQEALIAAASEEHLLCVVTDLVMPGMSGVELIKALREERPDLPAIILSGYPLSADDALRESILAETFLQKPIGADRLLVALETIRIPG